VTGTSSSAVARALQEIRERYRIDADAIAAAHRASAVTVRRTPVVRPASGLGEMGGEVLLKAENLQLTGSYKLRGALNKMRALGADCPGVVAASAGNHAQGLAYAARASGVACSIFLPAGAPLAKVEAIRELGAEIHQGGATVDDCFAFASAAAKRSGWSLVHPFDDPEIIIGQGGVGVELIEDVKDLGQVVVPIGGGGLAAGIAIVVKSAAPEVKIVGVLARSCAPFVQSAFPQEDPGAQGAVPAIADGVAVKRPGAITGAIIERLVDELVVVEEQEIADAMVWAMERAKLVVEGAGAVSIAALLHRKAALASRGSTVAVLSGGNIDVGLIGAVVRHHESRVGRRMRLGARIDDRPGSLAELLQTAANAGANLIDVHHVRDGLQMDVREVMVELTVETRGKQASNDLRAALREAGYTTVEV
jgi:threonine dehydratase